MIAGQGLLVAGNGNDTVTGSALADMIRGGAATTCLMAARVSICSTVATATTYWLAARVTTYLIGGTGNNILRGGAGADKLDGTGGWGVADYHTAQTAVTVNLDGSGNSGDEAAGDTFVNINGVQGSVYADMLSGNGNDNWMIGDGGNDTVKGGGGNDTLYGSNGDDQLVGGAGNDHLIGGTGNNVLEGGDGADVLDGTDGCGVADYRNSDTAVKINLATGGIEGDEAAGDTYINIVGAFGSAFGDTIVGDGRDNWVVAGGGDDTVSGGGGNDVIYGGSGKNVLTGGSGRDVYVFDAPGSFSRITDFSVAEDKIQLDRGVFGGFGASVSLAIGPMATNGGPQIVYNSGTGDLSYDADGLGGGVAVKFALLATGLALTANNFIL